MEKLIEALITKVYHTYRHHHYQKVFHYAPFLAKYLSEPLIRFGEFEFSYSAYGHASHRECYLIEGTKIYEHTIYLNKWFLSMLMGDENIPTDYNFSKLIETIAHETAHCLVFDFYPQISEEHGTNHSTITKKLIENLKDDILVRKLQTKFNELHN